MRSPQDPTKADQQLAASQLRRLQAVRLEMLEVHPFWGYLLLQVRLVAVDDLPCIAATDCLRHIWFNPRLTRHLAINQLGFVLAHEVGHQLLASGERQRGRNPHLWNLATDYAINRIVQRIGSPAAPQQPRYASPDGTYPELGQVKILLDPAFDGLVAEAIYLHLTKAEVGAPTLVRLDLPTGGAGGAPGRICLPKQSDHGGGIDIHLPEGALSDEDREVLRHRVEEAALVREAQGGKGDLPGEAQRVVPSSGRSSVPWQRVLHRFAGQALAKDDWSLARPNRRYLEQDLVVPGPCSDKAGVLVVSVDSSGSITPPQLAQLAAELRELTRLCESLTVLVSDTQVRQVIHDCELAAFLRSVKFKGGGGTDHRPVFDYLAQHRIIPDLFIGLTDLFTDLPPKAPPYPVLWALTPKHGKVPWGQVVVLE